jgi:hypothetical protein
MGVLWRFPEGAEVLREELKQNLSQILTKSFAKGTRRKMSPLSLEKSSLSGKGRVVAWSLFKAPEEL